MSCQSLSFHLHVGGVPRRRVRGDNKQLSKAAAAILLYHLFGFVKLSKWISTALVKHALLNNEYYYLSSFILLHYKLIFNEKGSVFNRNDMTFRIMTEDKGCTTVHLILYLLNIMISNKMWVELDFQSSASSNNIVVKFLLLL
jgi:hypothetical protein